MTFLQFVATTNVCNYIQLLQQQRASGHRSSSFALAVLQVVAIVFDTSIGISTNVLSVNHDHDRTPPNRPLYLVEIQV